MISDYKLVPCTRGPVPELRPLYDLAGSLSLAEQVIRKVDEHLQLSGDWFCFKGLARPADRYDGDHPLFYVQMWDKRGLYRSLAFRDIGFVGVLNIEVKKGNKNTRWFADYLGAAFHGVDQEVMVIGKDAASFCLGLVDGEWLTLRIPWRP